MKRPAKPEYKWLSARLNSFKETGWTFKQFRNGISAKGPAGTFVFYGEKRVTEDILDAVDFAEARSHVEGAKP